MDPSPANASSAPAAGARKLSRRGFLKWAFRGSLAAAVGIGIDGFLIEPRWIKVHQVDLAVPRLDDAWRGVRIAHITDIHRGPNAGLDFVRRIVDLTNQAAPDLIVFTGDAVSRPWAIGGDMAGVLAGLRAPMGVLAVLGNHDYRSGAQGVIDMLRQAGMDVLINEHRILHRGGRPICFAGLDDQELSRPDLQAALAGVPDEMPRIVLCHQPQFADTMPPAPRVDLMLSGHTHGGQFNVPIVSDAVLFFLGHSDARKGLTQSPHCPVFTSVGLGMAGVPIRFNCRPEIPILRLT